MPGVSPLLSGHSATLPRGWPNSRLNARLNAASDSSPMSVAISATPRDVRLVDDPKAYTKPWTVTLRQQIGLNTELVDEICLENEKSLQRMK